MKILRFTGREYLLVRVTDDEAKRLTDKGTDYLDVIEAAAAFRRAAAHGTEYLDAEVEVEEVEENYVSLHWVTVLDGDQRERFIWSARHFVGLARRELSIGRYREGHCPDLDRVNGALAKLEDELRLMGLAIDHPEWPEVVQWQASRS